MHFLHHKTQAFGNLKEWLQPVENEIGNKLKKFITNGGGEFTSKEFEDLCKGKGIKKQLTTAHTPQQNGVAKCCNQTIMEMA